jgi:excisionase family DNA binding protein
MHTAAYCQAVGGELISTAQAAKVLGIDRSTLARWAQQGIVKPAWTTPGGQHRWDLEDLRRQLLDARQRNDDE